MATRTRRQREVLDFIIRYIDGHGYEPSYQLIARELGVSSKAGIAKHIKALEDQGLLQRRRENGSFKLDIGRREVLAPSSFEVQWMDVASNDDPEPWVSTPFALPLFLLGDLSPKSICAFRVPDDSMSGKHICEGDVALVESRSYLRDGDCAVVTIKRKETVLRQYYREGSRIELRPANNTYDVLRVAGEHVKIHGVYRCLVRPIC
ncbi:MAG TPA: S24 family peptidase [Pyrinomonadaceae bacterium]